MRTENTLHLRSIVLVLLMLTSFTVPLITPFEPSEETELENQFQRYETTTSDTSVAVMLKDIRTGFASSSISQIRVVPGPNGVDHTVFFKANNGTSGEELWKSDGTPEGTMIVKDINTGGGGAGIDHLTVVGSTLFFRANDGSNSAELWKSDGTSAGTVMVKDINPGSNSSDPNFLTAVGDLLFFRAVHPSSGCELWVSDGTSNGTFMLKDIYSGAHPNNGYPESLTAVGNNLYFTVYNTGYQLWKSNGTTAGTTLVKIIASTSGRAAELTAMGNTLFFSAQSPAAGTSTGDELWASEGTDNSTWMVKDINPGSSSSSPERLAAVGNTIYFHATDGTNGYELWKSNGTSSGTMMVKNIMSGAGSSSPATLTAVGNTLYFQANDGTNGLELWKSDGTSSGTAMVKDIRVGSAGSSAGYFSASGSTLYFDANDGINGHELWKTDGTSGGTVMVDDIHLGVNSSNPQRVSISDSGVGYFKADNGVNGVELWKVIDNPCYINGTIINNATEWVHCVGGNNEDVEVASVAVDSSGNTYYTGSFGGFVLFGDIPLYSSGGSDIFIAKLSSTGSWQWAVKAGGSPDDTGYGIAVDSSGNAYATGYFQGTATFGSTSLVSSGSNDIFIAKLSSSGSWQWAVKAGGSTNDGGYGIAVGSSGNAYVTGMFQGTATFGSTSLTSSGGEDIFIAKLSSSGSWQWAVKAGGSSVDSGYGIAVDSSGNAYVTGFFQGTATFGSTSLTSSGSFDIFVAKSSSSGSWQWAVKTGGSSPDYGKGIAVDSSGNAYVTGGFEGTATFGSTSLVSSGSNDIFIAKLSSSGSWQWAVKAGGSSFDYGNGIAVDSSGNAYVTGVFKGTATFGNTSLTSNGDSDAFIGQVDSSGNWVWANNGGGTGSDEGTSIALGSYGIGYMGGYFSGDADIGMQSFTCLSSKCGMFVKTSVGPTPAADGNISVNLEFDYANTWLNGNWAASDLVTGHDYNVSWTLEYQNNGTVISNGWPDSFYPQSASYSSANRTWASGVEGGKLVCYEVKLRDGDGFSGLILDTATSCTRTPVELTDLTPSDVSDAVQRSSAANCAVNSNSNIQNNICDGDTGSNWVSADNYDPYNITIDFDLGTTAVEVNAVAAYVNSPTYTSTIKNVRLQYLNATGAYENIGIFQIDRTTGWQYFGGFSVTTTEIRWDVLSNHGFQHTVLFEGKVLDIPDKIFNSNGDWNSSNSLWTYSVAWGDVDSDGDLDLAVGNADDSYGPSEVYSNGGSALSSSRSWASVSNLDTRSVSWGDVDNDGDLDLAVGNLGNQNEIYLNTGTGLATTPTWTSTNSLQTYSIAWGDVDGDGDLDLAVGNVQANNEVYLNDNGEFATSADWTSENSLNTIVVVWVDVDSDGDLDLSVGNTGNNEIYINSGTSLDATPDWTSSNSLNSASIAWGDIDDDGHLDMVVANDGGSNELYLSNNGVLATTSAWTSNNSLSSKSIALGDVDGDGDLDMAVGNYNQNNEVYLYSNGAFTTTPAWTGALTQKTFSVAWGDVDGDGDLDLAIGEQQSKNQVYLNQLNDGGAGADGLPDIDLVGGSDSGISGQNLATGDSHSCAIQKNETLRCWGENNWGQLGSQQYDEGGQYSTPQYNVELPTGTVPLAVSAAQGYSCAIVDNGSNEAYCWGKGDNGKLGNGNLSNSNVPGNKVVLASGANPVYISSSDGHSCVVSDDGDIYCWGLNNQGQLGNGSQGGYSSIPVIVNSGVGFKSVSAGYEYSCAISIDGGLYCWGNNNNGQLGDGTYNLRTSPVQITSGPTSAIWKEVAVSESHTCAISSSDEIYCWGLNGDGQLGDGTRDDANTPQLASMPSGTTAVSVSAGLVGFTCGVLENHSTYCWGANGRGYLGDGSWLMSLTPIAIDLPSGSEVVEISSGREHSCILLANDQIMCWGGGGHGRLGTDSHDDSPSPTYVVGGHVWNGLGKDFYHFAPQISFPVTDLEPRLSIMIPLSPLPSGMAISMTSKVTLDYNGIIIEAMSIEEENLSWVDTLDAEWWSVDSFYYKVPSISMGYSTKYCIEIELRSSLTGDSIGHGMECNSYQPGNSNDGDFAVDDFEDIWGSSTSTGDEDGDGYSDWMEYWYGGDFSNPEITPQDSDGDGLPDELEEASGSYVNETDTDGDGYDDYAEFMFGGRPIMPSYYPYDHDYDDCFDVWEEMVGLNITNPDSDGDGVLDCFEDYPLDPSDTPTDSDGDGMPDGLEEEYGTNPENWDSDGDGMPDSFEITSGTDPWDSNSHSISWATDWSNELTLKPEASATASSSAEGHPASLTIDTNQEGGVNDTTYWTSSGPCPATIEVDFGSVQYMAHMDFQIIVPTFGHYPRNISFEYRESSADDWIYYQSYLNGDERPSEDYWNGDSIPLQKARYIRLNCSDSTDDLGNEYEISISLFRVWGAKNTQFINPDMGTGNESSQPSIEAYLNIDSMNQLLTAGYSAQLMNGLDYDIDWRLVETNQGECSDIPSSIDEGSLSIQNWDSAENGSLQQIFVDYSSISNWNIELCLQLDLNQGEVWLYTDWILVSASGSQNNDTQSDTDGDGVNDIFDICPETSPDTLVDSTGCPIDNEVETTHNSTLEVEFIEHQSDSIWYQKLTMSLDEPWLGYNHSLSIKLKDENGNTVYSYFSPMDESDQNGWWKLSGEMDQNPTELEIDLNWEGIVGNGRWEGSSRFFEDDEYPYFSAGTYCVEVSLGYQDEPSTAPMDVINNLFDKEEICGEFLHDSMDGAAWDGSEELPQSTLDKVIANKVVSTFLDFMDSTQGQILSIGLAILGFAGKMVLARGQRSKNKRVDKFSKAIRKADTKGRLKIIEMGIEKANLKKRLPRGGYGDLMEQIEAQLESLGFDSNPEQGETSGNWTSGDDQDYAEDFQQAADMMWEAQDMMAEAKEEATMTREAIESVQDQLGMQPQRRAAAKPEPEEAFTSKYVTQGIDGTSGAGGGPSLPGGRMMDLDGDGVVTDEEKEIWGSMSSEERTEFFKPVTDIAGEIKRRNMLREKREKLNKNKRGSKKKKKGKKDKGRW